MTQSALPLFQKGGPKKNLDDAFLNLGAGVAEAIADSDNAKLMVKLFGDGVKKHVTVYKILKP